MKDEGHSAVFEFVMARDSVPFRSLYLH